MKRIVGALAISSATTSQVHALDPDGGCRLLSVLPFSDASVFTSRGPNRTFMQPYKSNYSRWSEDTIAMTGYTYMAAALLAIEHFNNREAQVVPEIANLPTSCTAFFSNESTVVNGALNNLVSGKHVFEASTSSKPCAIVGPYGIIPSMWTAPMTSILDVPQIFFATAPSIVTEPDLYPNTVRTTVHTTEYCNKILSFVKHMKRGHLAVVHGGSDYDRTMALFLVQQSTDFNVNVTLFPLYPPSMKVDPQMHALNILQMVKKSGIRTIFRVFIDGGPGALEKLAVAAETHGLLDDDYLYILEENTAPVDDLPRIVGVQQANSAMDRLLSGAVVVSATEVWESDSDSLFLQSWRSQNKAFVDLVNGKVPLAANEPEYFQGSSDFFQTHLPRRGATLVYDSVMAVGFGACHAQTFNHSSSNGTAFALGNQTGKSPHDPALFNGGIRNLSNDSPALNAKIDHDSTKGPPPGSSPPPLPVHEIKNPHVKGIAQTVFTGASGRLAFGLGGGQVRDRGADDVSFGAHNIRPVTQPDGTHRYEVVLVTHTIGKEWHTLSGRDFVFRDGTSALKGMSRVMFNENFLPTWVRIFGLALMTIAWCVALGLLLAVWRWREKPLIKAGQPVFLYIVCVGSILTSSAILTLSFDEASGWSNRQLGVACTMTPWLFFLGINSTFAGLFCKLWRVNLVTQFRRRQVKILQTAWPLIILLVSTVLCLLVWTIVDPSEWKRDVIVEYPPESYGRCGCEHFAAYFSTLCFIMILATALAFGMAWKTKGANLDSRFSDTNSLFLAIASQLQGWFVGMPILAVLEQSSAEATFLGRILLVWLFSMGSVLIVIAPKVYQTFRHPNESARTSRIFVSGLHTDMQNSSSVIVPKSDAKLLTNSGVASTVNTEKVLSNTSSTDLSTRELQDKTKAQSDQVTLCKTLDQLINDGPQLDV